MSEYTYACPVCGQHMRCDSSQAGTVMECPTCFQKITAPQAPASEDQKFILAGQKYVEGKIPTSVFNAAAQAKAPAGEKFSIWIIVVIIAVLAAGGGIYYFYGEKSFSGKPSGEKPSSGTPARLVLAAGWQAGDIGNVGADGSFSQADGVLTISGSGANIWHQADGFYYVFQTLNGDGSLVAHVLNIQNTHEWAKTGVMIRETTNASSEFALSSIRSDGQAQFIWRNVTGADAAASRLAGGTGCPKWLKIVRSGKTFGAYYKVNAGDEWMQVGTTQTISMAPSTQVGLIVCSHNAGTLCQAQFDQVTLQTNLDASPAAAPAVPKPPQPKQ
ncbi:MAG: hypothetical protein PHY43_02515 [Verrucomicrobiales bacterium]|nr:hypothetical protein [Verrucomicrobiales bacterium]